MIDMSEQEREHHAREILSNPLFSALMAKMEQEAINRAVNAQLTDNLAQQAALAEVRAVRSFRQNCEFLIRNKPPPKAAPA